MNMTLKAARWYLVFAVTLIFLFAWLPLVRCIFDGASYEWGTTHFGFAFRGAGLGGNFWFLPVKLLVGVAALYGVCRLWRPGLWIAGAVALAWFADALIGYVEAPDAMIFRGDTLGIEVNIGLVSVIIYGLAVPAAAILLARIAALPPHRPPDGANRRALLVLAALLPVQFVLLRFGEPHGATDAAGVILTILQWLAVPFALRWRGKSAGHALP